jgi:hypothetical protein
MSSTKKRVKEITDSSQVSDITKPVVANFDDHGSRPEHKFGLNKLLSPKTFLYIVGLLIIVGTLYFFLTGGFHRNTVVIGNTQITKKKVDDFAQQLSDYQKSHPGASFGSNLSQYASDKLILNAALKLEAKKYNVTLSDDDLAQAGSLKFPSQQAETGYFDSLRNAGTSIQLINMENVAYQTKLQNKLLDKKELTVVNLMLDTPYYRNLPQNQVQAAYNKAKSRMENTFLALVSKGVSEQDIAKKADIASPSDNAPAVSTAEDNAAIARELAQYNNQGVVSVGEVEYQKGVTNFNDNDSTSWIRGNIGKVYQTSDKVDQLKNVGDNTGLFASKAGNFTIIRLDAKTGGSYDSWADFLNYYKNRYAHGKLQINSTQLSSTVLGLASRLTQTIMAPGLGQAWADSATCNESDHKYAVTVVAWDSSSGAALSGGTVQFSRTAGTSYNYPPYKDADGTQEPGGTVTACGETGTFSITSNGSFNPQTDSKDSLGAHGNTFVDNCANTPLEFSANSVIGNPNPSAYQPIDNSSGTNASWQHPNFDGSTTGNLEDGFPDPPNEDSTDHIRPGLANTNTYTIVLQYQPTAPTWTLDGESRAAAGGPAGGSIGTIIPGQSDTFYHWVYNNGPDKATNYYWHVQQSYGGGSGSYSDVGLNATTSVGPGGYNPNDITSNPTPWPNNTPAANGSLYCQRIVYSEAHGPASPTTSDTAVSTPWCVKLDKTPPSTPIITCNSAYVPAPPPPNPQIPPIPPDTSTGWSGSTTNNPIDGYADVRVSGTDASTTEFKEGTEYTNLNVKSGGPGGAIAHQPYTLSYNPAGSTVSVTYTYYEYALRHDLDSNGNRVYQLYQLSSTTVNLTCYSGTSNNTAGACSLTVTGGDGPGGVITAGQTNLNVSGTIYNYPDPAHPEKTTLPASLPNGDRLSLTFNGEHDVGASIPVGSVSAPINLGQITANAGPNPSTQTISAYPDYYGTGPIGPACSTSFSVYAPFTLTPNAQVTLHNTVSGIDTDENPNEVISTTSVIGGGTPISEHVTSSLSSSTSACGSATVNSTSNDGPFNPGATTYLYNNYTYPTCTTPLKAGDNYCADIYVPVAFGGFVGPGGDIVGGAPAEQKTCANVNNKPFFKVFNGGAAAGGAFSATSGGSCSGGGTLASWNNDTGTYPTITGGDFGASAQLNALALKNIVGFGSSQPPFGQSPTYLSFANNDSTNITGDNYSPRLGGAFDPTGNGYCFTDKPAPSTGDVTSYASSQHLNDSGQLTIPLNDEKSVYVTGDVYIAHNVVYSSPNSGLWNLVALALGFGSIPHFELHATGNIYIDPSVTELDGLYTSQGKIYTCGAGTAPYADGTTPSTPYAPMLATELFDNCNKQLTVYGNFVGSQVNMMRTFGSLRDETPRQTTTVPQTQNDYPVQLLQYSCQIGNASIPYQHSHWYVAANSGGTVPPLNAPNPQDTCPNPTLDPVNDGYIFPPSDTTFTTRFLNGSYWLLCEDVDHISGGGGDHYVQILGYDQSAACTGNGNGGTVLGYIPNTPVAGTTPLYENFDGPPFDSNPPHCFNNGCSGFHYISTTDNLEEEGIWGYVYTSALNGDQTYIKNVAVLGGPAILNSDGSSCSNRRAPFVPLAPQTCAAEVFFNSPERYLSTPPPGNSSSGKWDEVTNLPPVL